MTVVKIDFGHIFDDFRGQPGQFPPNQGPGRDRSPVDSG